MPSVNALGTIKLTKKRDAISNRNLLFPVTTPDQVKTAELVQHKIKEHNIYTALFEEM